MSLFSVFTTNKHLVSSGLLKKAYLRTFKSLTPIISYADKAPTGMSEIVLMYIKDKPTDAYTVAYIVSTESDNPNPDKPVVVSMQTYAICDKLIEGLIEAGIDKALVTAMVEYAIVVLGSNVLRLAIFQNLDEFKKNNPVVPIRTEPYINPTSHNHTTASAAKE